MSKKNIDKLFQEKLKDFQEMPEEHVWNSISASLDKKKSRKIIPFWWQLGGVAAVLAVFFAVYNPSNDKTTNTPAVTDIENVTPENPTNNINSKDIQFEEEPEDQIKIANTDFDTSSPKTKTDTTRKAIISAKQNADKQSDFKTSQNKTTTTQLAAATSAKNDNSEHIQVETNTNIKKDISTNNDDGLAVNDSKIPKEDKSRTNLTTNELPKNSIEESLSKASEKKNIENADDKRKKSIFDEIEKETENEQALAENSTSKWSVGANLAPVYFNSFGEGSSIDPSFNNNSKSGIVNMSYGLSIAYDVSNKLSIRSGVNKVNYGYNTNEVEFSPSLQGSLSSRLNNVNYTESAENIAVGNKSENVASLANRSSDVISNNSSRNGVMAQEFGYIEVPVELDYALVENRFGVNLVGGVSTLFLTNNSVALNSSDEIIELGEANNLNSVNFSTNVGFGLNYKFSTKVRFNVEPVFKYQLGTFSDTSGSFNPFSIGVYSGLNFKF
ncbi:hypothetical protein GH721_10860 [Kriegella sp. EG-1]|nr:hypothetical protein [Flavobacteriaceae bacterium EG-1]